MSTTVPVSVRRFLALTATLCSFALVGSGLSPAAAAPAGEPDPAAGTVAGAGQTDTRPDAVSAQVTAKATGHRVEDLSQRSTTTQVFANPDGTWAMESFTLPRFRAADDGTLVPIKDAGTFTDAGTAFTGAGAEITVSDGGEPGRAGSVPLVELTGTGQDADRTLVLGWEGALPEPEIDGAQAVYDDGVQVTVEETAPSAPPGAGQDPQDTGTAAPTPGPAAAEASADARVVVEPTRTGFLHTVVLDRAPDGDVVLRFPLDFSAGLKAELNPENSEIRVKDRDGDTVFHAPTPLMWDAKTNEASGLPAAETPVDTELLDEDGTQVLVLRADRAWLNDPAREYPVTIDPAWSGAAGGDTWVQSGSTVGHGGSTELRVGTFDGGATKARSYMKFSVQALTSKKILKAEVRLNNHYSYSCTSSEIRLQRVGAAWDTNALVWTGQPVATATGQGTNTQSKGYSSACAAGSVLFPATPIVQYWADNPTQNFGVRIIAADETNSHTWKRYRSNDHVSGAVDPVEPHLLVTYNSYPDTAPAPTFGTGQSSTHTAGSATTTYVKTLKPDFRAMVSDPDKGNVTAQFEVVDSNGTKVLDKVGGTTVPSGSTSVLKGYTASLTNGRTYTATAWSHDGTLRSPAAGPATTFTVDTTAPAAPTVSSTAYTDNGWLQTRPAANTFTFASASTDTAKFQHSKDGGAWTDVAATGTNPRTAALDWNPYSAHQLRVRAVDKAGNISQERTFTFMNGLAALTAPAAGTTTTDAFRVQAKAPASGTGTVTPTVYWRPAQTADGKDNSTYGSTDNLHGWLKAQELDPVAPNTEVRVDTTLDIAASPTNGLKDLGKERVAALVEIQVCFAYAGQTGEAATQCSTNSTHDATAVTRLPHAFGNAFPTTEAGTGQAALTTGELNLSETDVSIDAGNTGLSISRTHSSYSGLGANSAILGAGWRANLDGPDEGLAGMLVAEATAVDGTITLIDTDETTLVFRQAGNGKTPLKTGTYAPANKDATASGLKLELTGTGTSARIKATEPDGTATTFIQGSALEAGTAIHEWTPETVTGPAATGTTRFTRDSTGKTTRITAGTETALDCTDEPATGADAGCRILDLAYEAGSNRLSTVKYTAWDPAANGGTGAMVTKEQASYTYKTHGTQTVLATVRDARTGDTTHYDYGTPTMAGVPAIIRTEERSADNKLVSAPVHYGYGTGPTPGGRPDWLETVHRGDPATGAGKTQVARIVYGVPTAGDGTHLPKLDTATTGLWEQGAPEKGAAVFGMGKTINTSHAATLGLDSEDWRHAEITYWDTVNRTTNTAFHGAGAWQYDATVYSEDSLPVRAYSASATDQIRANAQGAAEGGVYAGHWDFATITAYHDGTGASAEHAAHVRGFPTDTWGPVAPNQNGKSARVHSTTTYTPLTDLDAGGMPRMLPLTVVLTETESKEGQGEPRTAAQLQAAGANPETVIGRVVNSYDAWEADSAGRTTTNKANTRSGWVHGTPTLSMQDVGDGTTIDTRIWLDEKGRATKTLQPASTGDDAGTTQSIYYTAGDGVDAACKNKPAYAGYLCKTAPQGPGSVTEHQTSFNFYGQVTETREYASDTSTVLRTTTQTYRADGQDLRTTTTTSGVPGSAAIPATEKLYDALGRHTGNRVLDGRADDDTTWTLDLWGRTASYTNAQNETTTTTYNGLGEVEKTQTPHSTSTYWYGARGGDGATEYRSLPTKMTLTNHGQTGNTATYTAAYNLDGNITRQDMPAGMSQTQDYDSAGRPTTLAYQGPITREDGTPGTGTWISWTQARNTAGQIVAESTPDGILLSGAADTGDPAASFEREYTYDQASRLTQVTDRTAPAGQDLDSATTRAYTFDKNGNRLSVTTTVGADTATFRNWSYDAADRIGTGNGYVYDGLGRQTTIPEDDAPGVDAQAAGTGDITLSYYADDTAHTIARGGDTTTIGLDPDGRRITLDSTSNGINTQHYTDRSDNPAWTSQTIGTTTTTTRYETTLNGNLALTIEDGTAKLAINNPHGDTVATTMLPATGSATGIDAWAQYDEYGNQKTALVDTGATTYAWHGADQRASETSGLILMGARLYNSATGHFTSNDPLRGGNTTQLAYPQDPIGQHDISGQYRACGIFCSAAVNVGYGLAMIGCRAIGIGGILCGAVAGALTEFSKYLYQWQGDRRFSWKKAAQAAALGAIVGGISLAGMQLIGKAVIYALKRSGKTTAAKYFATAFDVLYRKAKHKK